MTRRALAKLRTRQTLIASARRLFAERGYEAATVRDIAAAADLSTGAVFANFADKAELFCEILAADNEALAALMTGAGQSQTDTRAALDAALAAACAFHNDQLPLFRAAQEAAWSHDTVIRQRAATGQRQISAVLQQILRRGLARGEFQADLDVSMIGDLISQAYLSNYRLAAFEQPDRAAMIALLSRQIDLILGLKRI